MDAYELLLFLHVLSVAFWLGAELFVEILVFRGQRQGNAAAVRGLFDELNALDPVMIPATLLVPATGIVMVIDGPWSFGSTWIALGLAGFAFIYLYGFGCMQPQVNRLRTMGEGESAFGPEAQALMRRFFALWRIETAALVLLVFDMTIKPTGDDGGTLVAMAAALAAAVAHSLWRGRTTDSLRYLPARTDHSTRR
jgi:uncharacterized membrane protein